MPTKRAAVRCPHTNRHVPGAGVEGDDGVSQRWSMQQNGGNLALQQLTLMDMCPPPWGHCLTPLLPTSTPFSALLVAQPVTLLLSPPITHTLTHGRTMQPLPAAPLVGPALPSNHPPHQLPRAMPAPPPPYHLHQLTRPLSAVPNKLLGHPPLLDTLQWFCLHPHQGPVCHNTRCLRSYLLPQQPHSTLPTASPTAQDHVTFPTSYPSLCLGLHKALPAAGSYSCSYLFFHPISTTLPCSLLSCLPHQACCYPSSLPANPIPHHPVLVPLHPPNHPQPTPAGPCCWGYGTKP